MKHYAILRNDALVLCSTEDISNVAARVMNTAVIAGIPVDDDFSNRLFDFLIETNIRHWINIYIVAEQFADIPFFRELHVTNIDTGEKESWYFTVAEARLFMFWRAHRSERDLQSVWDTIKYRICPDCDGSGDSPYKNRSGEYMQCPACQGLGRREVSSCRLKAIQLKPYH